MSEVNTHDSVERRSLGLDKLDSFLESNSDTELKSLKEDDTSKDIKDTELKATEEEIISKEIQDGELVSKEIQDGEQDGKNEADYSVDAVKAMMEDIENSELCDADTKRQEEEREDDLQHRLASMAQNKLDSKFKREQLQLRREVAAARMEQLEFVRRAHGRYYRAKITDQEKMAAKLVEQHTNT